jgi:hypothetical protein
VVTLIFRLKAILDCKKLNASIFREDSKVDIEKVEREEREFLYNFEALLKKFRHTPD